MVLGCIPVVFEPQQLSVYDAFFTREEFLSMAVYIPEVYLTVSDVPPVCVTARPRW